MVLLFSDIKNQVLARADMSNSSFIGTSELEFYINQEYFGLYDLVIAAFDDYFMSAIQFTLDGTTDGYDTTNLNIYKLRGVDRQISGANTWATVDRFNFNDRNKFNAPFGMMLRAPFLGIEYAWTGNKIKIIPLTQNAGTYQLSYIPVLTQMDDSVNTTFNPILEQWADYVITGAAIKCLGKEESDASLLVMQQQALTARIQAMAPNRDNGKPKHVSDSYANVWGGSGYGGWGFR